ncbi:hypothetical protein ACQKP5_26410 [Pseudomonas vancouverensis]|uniref:hypothetical protein n=1 Tax=Pseudomonas vancouverensis TaxID=95300 RepID=UPI003D093642
MWIIRLKKALLSSVILFLGVLSASGTATAMSFMSGAAVSGIAAQVATMPTVLPDRLNTVEDSLAGETDVKHYSFISVRGQDVLIHAGVTKGRPLLLEYGRHGNWTAIPWGESFKVTGLVPNQVVEVRISTKPTTPFLPANVFDLEFGSAPYYADSRVRGDAGEIPLYWATTQAYRVLNWSVLLKDSKGHPVEGASATLILNKGAGESRHHLLTDSAGSAADAIQLGGCHGLLTSNPFWTSSGKYRYKWEVEYNRGYWLIQVQGKESSGVGGHNVPNVSFAQICYQRMLRS